MKKKLLLVNGSLRGREGNTARMLRTASRRLPPEVRCEEVVLADYDGSVEALVEHMMAADALLFGTGVYWGSWGSPLQRFLEVMTGYESSACFFGKPAAVAVTMDSVGGEDVAQRLVGTLSALGCIIPPLGMVVVSRVATLVGELPGNEDVWQPADLEVTLHNLLLATRARELGWATWPMIRVDPCHGRYPGWGPLRQGLATFLPEEEAVGPTPDPLPEAV